MKQSRKKPFTLAACLFLENEIMIAKNNQFVREEFEKILKLKEEKKTDWELVIQRHFTQRPVGNKPYSTKDLSIPVTEFTQLLYDNGFYKFDTIEVDDYKGKQYLKKMGRYNGFGIDDFAIFFTIEDNLVKHIWVDPLEFEKHNIAKICTALKAIGDTYQMMMVDWALKICVDLTNDDEIAEYVDIYDEE
ncbi:hypothetical protein [Kordia sp.]|uniref:hypothetical protein n=1 Tax=Kordia sp. TaxID=1965332 RepID=UPI003B5BB720